MGCDLEVEIRATNVPGEYDVSVDSPAGTASEVIQLDASRLLGRRRELAASVLASAVTSRSVLPSLERPVRDVGTELFQAVFVERVYGRYTASVQEAARRGEPLRVILRLKAPELAGLPWEALFDAEAQEYLCQREPVVRYVETAQPASPLAVEPPLRILGLVAAPDDLPALDVDEERRRLAAALHDLVEQGLVELDWTSSGTWPALQEKLQEGPWHVLHVIGHGGADAAVGGLLALEDERTRHASLVSAGRFARLLHACRPVPRLVVLNSCSSGEAAAEDLLSSTAAALVHSGISAAVAMQFAVTDPAALAFSRGFYRALARNTPVDEAVRLGRIAIDGTSEQTLEWVTPVLYLRTAETRLFTLPLLDKGHDDAKRGTHGEDIALEATLYGLYVQALAATRNELYDEATSLLDSLLTLDPTYRDADERRQSLRRTQRLIAEYEAARGAEDERDWDAARRAYKEVIAIDGSYRDAAARYEQCRKQTEIASLQDELRVHASARDWKAVLAVSKQLAAIDPAAADPDGLATRARAALPPQPAALQSSTPVVGAAEEASKEHVSAPRLQGAASVWPETRPEGHTVPDLRHLAVPERPQRHWVGYLLGGVAVLGVVLLIALWPREKQELPVTTLPSTTLTPTSETSSPATVTEPTPSGPTTNEPGAPPPVGLADPKIGRCRQLAKQDIAKAANASAEVDCSEEHTAVTFAVGSFSSRASDAIPTATELAQRARAVCRDEYFKFLGGTEQNAIQSLFGLAWFRPPDAAWQRGARWLRCDVVAQTSVAPLPLPSRAEGLLVNGVPDEWSLCRSGDTFASADKVRCTDSHNWKAVGAVSMSADQKEPYPDKKELEPRAIEACDKLQAESAVDVRYQSSYPPRGLWDAGLQYATCWVAEP
jgi:tetratricopeptide (TPR) repeat protein